MLHYCGVILTPQMDDLQDLVSRTMIVKYNFLSNEKNVAKTRGVKVLTLQEE